MNSPANSRTLRTRTINVKKDEKINKKPTTQPSTTTTTTTHSKTCTSFPSALNSQESFSPESTQSCDELSKVLERLSMTQYQPIFQQELLDMETIVSIILFYS